MVIFSQGAVLFILLIIVMTRLSFNDISSICFCYFRVAALVDDAFHLKLQTAERGCVSGGCCKSFSSSLFKLFMLKGHVSRN